MAKQRTGCGTWIALAIGLYLLSKCFAGHHEDRPTIASTEPSPVAQLRDSGVESSSSSSDAVTARNPANIDEGENGEKAATSVDLAPNNSGSYIDVDGHQVSSPVFSSSVPQGASARCADGSYSFSHHRRGTCSRHGGVAEWL